MSLDTLKLTARVIAAAALLAVSASATASDGFGIATFVFGIPLLLFASIVLGVMLTRTSSKIIKMLSVLVFVPTLLVSLSLIPDALTLFRYGLEGDAVIGCAFFALLPVVCFSFLKLMSR